MVLHGVKMKFKSCTLWFVCLYCINKFLEEIVRITLDYEVNNLSTMCMLSNK